MTHLLNRKGRIDSEHRLYERQRGDEATGKGPSSDRRSRWCVTTKSTHRKLIDKMLPAGISFFKLQATTTVGEPDGLNVSDASR